MQNILVATPHVKTGFQVICKITKNILITKFTFTLSFTANRLSNCDCAI